MENGTIDITNVVSALQKSFVDWAVAYIFGLEVAIPGLSWVALPVISSLDQAVIRAVLNLLSTSAVMQAFFINTAIKKASEAQDYISAVEFKNSLPPTATSEEIEDAEKKEMALFRSFVTLSQ